MYHSVRLIVSFCLILATYNCLHAQESPANGLMLGLRSNIFAPRLHLAGGYMAYNDYRSTVTDYSSLEIRVGYSLARRWTVGLSAGWMDERVDQPDRQPFTSKGWYAGPFVRFAYPVSKKINLFAEAEVQLGKRAEWGLADLTHDFSQIRLGPGVAYRVTPNIMVDFTLAFQHNHSTSKGKNTYLAPLFGVSFLLGRKP